MTSLNDADKGEAPVYPKDIDPESGFRLPAPRREDMDEEGQAAFDSLLARADGKLRGRAGPGVGLKGPGGIILHSPAYAARAAEVNWYLRFQSGIDGRIRELAILVAAREIDQQFEFTGHVPMALGEGLEQEIIDIVAERGSVEGLAEIDAVVITLGREAIGDHKVSSETFARALKLFGPRMLVDIVGLMSDYVSSGIMMTVFDFQLRPGMKGLMPPRRPGIDPKG